MIKHGQIFADSGESEPTQSGAGMNLAENARSFIGKTPAEAALSACIIMDSPVYDASLICGPLSMAPLAGMKRDGDRLIYSGAVIARGMNPKDFWLADYSGAEADPTLFTMGFDPSFYEFKHFEQNLTHIDFNKEPLEPGDFLYLVGGSYTHFITVNRKDAAGRTYTVTNTPLPSGEFIIDEKMLWDPALSDGFIYDFSRGIGPENMVTGRGGFYLWHLKVPFDRVEAAQVLGPQIDLLKEAMAQFFRSAKGEWSALIYDLSEDKMVFEWRSRLRCHPASTIKVPIAITALSTIQERFKDQITAEGFDTLINSAGYEGRTFRQLFESMLIYSEDEATESLTRYVYENGSFTTFFASLGLEFTLINPRRSSQSDLLICWNHLYKGNLLSREMNRFLLELLQTYTENDDIRFGVIHEIMPDAKLWNKRGSIIAGPYTMQDSGMVCVKNHYYYIGAAVFKRDYDDSINNLTMDADIEVFARLFGHYAKARR